MKTYAQRMEDYLAVNGWDVYSRFTDHLEWWADEIWQLKSRWSPSSAEAHLIFLVDPLEVSSGANRLKGQHVWGIACCKDYPNDRLEAESLAVIALNKQFKAEMDNFLLRLESLRY